MANTVKSKLNRRCHIKVFYWPSKRDSRSYSSKCSITTTYKGNKNICIFWRKYHRRDKKKISKVRYKICQEGEEIENHTCIYLHVKTKGMLVKILHVFKDLLKSIWYHMDLKQTTVQSFSSTIAVCTYMQISFEISGKGRTFTLEIQLYAVIFSCFLGIFK